MSATFTLHFTQEAMTEAMQVLDTPEPTTPAKSDAKKRKIDEVAEEVTEEKPAESEEPSKKKKKKKRKSEAAPVPETPAPGKYENVSIYLPARNKDLILIVFC